MRRSFQFVAPNGLFGDPLVAVRPRLLARTLLLDAGDAQALSARALLAVTDVLVSHAHVDHVFGLARLLRIRLGRLDRPLRLWGPPGLAAKVRSHLGAYSWNLVDAFPLDLAIHEVHPAHVERWAFPRAGGFEPFPDGPARPVAHPDEPVLEDDLLRVHAQPLDHAGLASLAWRVVEHRALNIDPVALTAAGLPTGPWLATLKEAIRRGTPPSATLEVPGVGARPVGELRRAVILETAGDSVAYATDVAPTAETIERLAAFAAGARRLVIEAHFLEEDRALAERHGHLTARLAGTIAQRAAPGAVSPIHVSTRYSLRGAQVLDELAAAADPVPLELLPEAAEPGEPEPDAGEAP